MRPTSDRDDPTLQIPAAELHRGRLAPTVHRAQSRPLGLEPQVLLASLSALLAGLSLVLLVAGGWILGLVVLLLGALLGAVFLASARREPDTALARAALTAVDRAESLARLVAVAGAAGMRGLLAVATLTQRRLRLRRELRRQLVPLGEAVHRGEEQRARQLKAHTQRLELALDRNEREQAEVLRALRCEVDRELASAEATRTLPALSGATHAEGAFKSVYDDGTLEGSPSGREQT